MTEKKRPFTILHAPLKAPLAKANPDRVVTGIRKHNADFTGLSEAYGIIPTLADLPARRLVLETGGKDKRRGQKDNPILVRSSLVSMASGQVYGCDASEPIRIAPERWITFAAVRLPGRRRPHVHFCLHPHAGIQGDDGGIANNDRGNKFREQMAVFEEMLTWAYAMGWTRSASGDWNARDIGESEFSPYVIMRDNGMTVFSKGLDAIGWDRSLRMAVEEVAAPEGTTDHPWLKAVSRG